jgi:anti-sigma regulatory factor (Ser/Thr protein kinase)
LLGCLLRSESSFILRNDCTLFEPLITHLQESISYQGLCAPADCSRIGMALAEALSNALYHGNLEVGSILRAEDDQAYWDLVTQRSSQRPYSDRHISVTATLSHNSAEFVICDQGPGFNPQDLLDPTDPENLEKPSGRGILVMRTFMDAVYFNDAGNSVTLKKYCRPRS